MFVRKKTTPNGTAKHYLVENRREGGKVRQKVLYYLGSFPTPEAEIAFWQARIRDGQFHADYWRKEAESVKGEGLDPELTSKCVQVYETRAAEYESHVAHCKACRDRLFAIVERGAQRC